LDSLSKRLTRCSTPMLTSDGPQMVSVIWATSLSARLRRTRAPLAVSVPTRRTTSSLPRMICIHSYSEKVDLMLGIDMSLTGWWRRMATRPSCLLVIASRVIPTMLTSWVCPLCFYDRMVKAKIKSILLPGGLTPMTAALTDSDSVAYHGSKTTTFRILIPAALPAGSSPSPGISTALSYTFDLLTSF